MGHVGVEHASPDTIRACLTRARPGFGTSRKEFNVEELKADGLVGSWDDKAQVRHLWTADRPLFRHLCN